MPPSARLVLLAALTLVAGCSAPEDVLPIGGSHHGGGGGGGGPIAPLELDVRSTQVSWSPVDGKTTLVVQFTARSTSGHPLAQEQLETSLFLDERALDNESLLQQDSEALSVNVHYGMVLDSSYSMLLHQPPAFAPMKAAARDSVNSLLGMWSAGGQKGQVSWDFLWFEEMLNLPTDSWNPDDLLYLPEPAAGSSTKLYSAVDAMVGRMRQKYEAGVAAGERDMHVLVVFSDGADNYSWFDNSSTPTEELLVPSRGRTYQRVGAPATSLEQLTADIAGHPRLTVHTIGLGNDIDVAALKQIAQAGHGLNVTNASSAAIGDLFAEVLQASVTVQTTGATMPLPPGDYALTLRARSSGNEATHTVRFHAGDASARVLP
jgi:hypothetical protein